MESFVWALRTFDTFAIAAPIALNLLICFGLTQTDYLLLLTVWFWRHARGRADTFVPRGRGERPTGMVVIPSLLRGRDDFDAIVTTVISASSNGYPGDLTIIASVDGRTELPALYRELCAWVEAQSFAPGIRVHVTGTETRLGKMMAVEAGVGFMKELVASGAHPAFPEIYFSIDGDGTLGAHAIERLAHRLTTPHPLTGRMRRVVAGKICIRPDLLWRGWRSFFTVEGQLYAQAAREFVVSNVSRFNWKITPRIGIPGALYCTWSQLLLEAPHYMAFMQGITARDVVKWWLGFGPPRYSESRAPALPEALTGASDDTCMAFLASLATWKDGKLCFDAPETPLHALGRFVRSYVFERSHDYEPEARVFTYTPPTLKALWKQRVRWNSSRVECAGRFWRAFWFHWEIGLPVSAHLILLLNTVFDVGFYYVMLPYYCLGSSHAAFGYALGYAAQTIAYGLYTAMALTLERDYRRYWRVMLCLPLASLYCITINCFGCVYGVTRDIFLFGNATNFAPEWTLMKGGCERIALLFRARRFLQLSFRALLVGDVPFGAFWFGWKETPWTPSGFEGWTTGKKPRSILVEALRARRASTARPAPPQPTAPAGTASPPTAAPPARKATVTRRSLTPRASVAPLERAA